MMHTVLIRGLLQSHNGVYSVLIGSSDFTLQADNVIYCHSKDSGLNQMQLVSLVHTKHLTEFEIRVFCPLIYELFGAGMFRISHPSSSYV